MSDLERELVKTIVSRVLSELEEKGASTPVGDAGGSRPGLFQTVDQAVSAAEQAQAEWVKMSLEQRERVFAALRQAMHDNAESFARMACDETGMGRVEDKILKHHTAADATPGTEDLTSRSWSGDRGLAVEEYAPYGLVAAVTPSTHPIPVLLNSIIIITACGNGAVFSVHPAAKQVSAHAMALFNRAIVEAGGPVNLVNMIEEPSLEAVSDLFGHPKISLIAATGGPALVNAAFRSGKKVIAAGPGNPPVVVDETACLRGAARQIIKGAGFDNNILCIAEKELFVVESVFDDFMEAMEKEGALRLNGLQVQSLTDRVFFGEKKGEWKLNRSFVGKDAAVLAQAAGRLSVDSEVRLLFGETEFDHPFVHEEQMMPFLPVVKASDFAQAVELAVEAEHGYQHTAMIHSNNLERITRFSRKIDTSIVVVNGSSLAGNGPPAGEGYFSHTIASPTGEGVCTPRDFARVRRLSTLNVLRFV